MKSCDNCYCTECGDTPEYFYKGKKYCFDCLLNELEIESYTITHYTCKDEYIANEDDIGQIISEWNKDIKSI